jgi:hypothetical protein
MPDLVNFIAGTHAIYWYFSRDQQASLWDGTKILVKYHMGSVAASAFLNGIFYFIDLIVDFFTVPTPLFSPNNPATKNPTKCTTAKRSNQPSGK